MNLETKLEHFKLIMSVLLYPAGLIIRHPILSILAWILFDIFTQIYNIQIISNFLQAYVTLSFIITALLVGLVARSRWVMAISVMAALLMMFTPLIMRSLV